jgi:hypothetical protein
MAVIPSPELKTWAFWQGAINFSYKTGRRKAPIHWGKPGVRAVFSGIYPSNLARGGTGC